MKRIFLITAFTTGLLGSPRSQSCDIAHTGIGLYNEANTVPIGTVSAGKAANFKFTILNFGSDLNCVIPANSVTAVFDFPNATRSYRYDGPSTFISGYFSWQYDAAGNVLQGTNILPIPNGKGDADVLVKVRGIAAGAGVSRLMLTQKNGIRDNWGNDNSSTRLLVTGNAIPPAQLGTFTVVPEGCNAVLNWTTISEEATFNQFDVEYSNDGITFLKIGSVKGKNSGNGSNYAFSYFQLGGSGYYRLKEAAKDGSFEYSNTVRTYTNCREKGKVIIYPNPVAYNQKVMVNISGYAGKISGDLYDALGKRIESYVLVNGSNELSVMTLAAGSYMLYVRNHTGQQESFKLVVTR